MAPKKANRSREEMTNLRKEFQITFEGPKRPKYWPAKYKHHFKVIRDIWATRYDDYITRTDIDQRTLKEQRIRVQRICQNARRLRSDIDINENTWRSAVEDTVFDRFGEEVLWLVSLVADLNVLNLL